jgi:hypothetical protein
MTDAVRDVLDVWREAERILAANPLIPQRERIEAQIAELRHTYRRLMESLPANEIALAASRSRVAESRSLLASLGATADQRSAPVSRGWEGVGPFDEPLIHEYVNGFCSEMPKLSITSGRDDPERDHVADPRSQPSLRSWHSFEECPFRVNAETAGWHG